MLMLEKIVSKAMHINPFTKMEVPDEKFTEGKLVVVAQDAKNVYVQTNNTYQTVNFNGKSEFIPTVTGFSKAEYDFYISPTEKLDFLDYTI